MTEPTNITSYAEDDFELGNYRKTADLAAREKSRLKSIRRQIFIGKVILAIVALSVSVLLYYVITVTVPLF